MPGSTLFTDAMALTPVNDGVYDGELNEHWTIGPKVHGGAMLALCANAARMEHSRGLGALPSQAGGPPQRAAQGTTRGSTGAEMFSRSPCPETFCGRRIPARCAS